MKIAIKKNNRCSANENSNLQKAIIVELGETKAP